MFSTYDERLKQTPQESSGRWTGKRGESLCKPSSSESRRILQEKGIDGITYHNAMPDFSPVSESTVDIAYMTKARSSKNVLYGKDGSSVEYRHKAVQESRTAMPKLMMKYDDPGNFQQADIITAENWSKSKKDGKAWTESDVSKYRAEHKLTWHECNDGKTMQLIPQAINSDFGHLGGVAETKRKRAIISEEARKHPTLQSSDEEVKLLNGLNDKQVNDYMRAKHVNQDNPQSVNNNASIEQKKGDRVSMDKKTEWEKQLQQWRDEAAAYRKSKQVNPDQQKVKKATNGNSDNNDMDNMQRRHQQKKKGHEMSR